MSDVVASDLTAAMSSMSSASRSGATFRNTGGFSPLRAAMTPPSSSSRASRDLDLERIVQSGADLATDLSGAKFGAFFYNVPNESGEIDRESVVLGKSVSVRVRNVVGR